MSRLARKSAAHSTTSAPAPVSAQLRQKAAKAEASGFNPVGGVQTDLQATHHADRWSSRTTSAFLIAVCGSFWALIALALLHSQR